MKANVAEMRFGFNVEGRNQDSLTCSITVGAN